MDAAIVVFVRIGRLLAKPEDAKTSLDRQASLSWTGFHLCFLNNAWHYDTDAKSNFHSDWLCFVAGHDYCLPGCEYRAQLFQRLGRDEATVAVDLFRRHEECVLRPKPCRSKDGCNPAV